MKSTSGVWRWSKKKQNKADNHRSAGVSVCNIIPEASTSSAGFKEQQFNPAVKGKENESKALVLSASISSLKQDTWQERAQVWPAVRIALTQK